MEDRVLAGTDRPLLIASFQQEKFYRQEAHRYRRLGEISEQVYVLAAPDTEFSDRGQDYELVPFAPTDALAQEWHLIAIDLSGKNFAPIRSLRFARNRPISEV
jgi:DICT domain-containing protein